jgi:hypothetical protein
VILIATRIVNKWIWAKRLPTMHSFKYKWKALWWYDVVQEDLGDSSVDVFWLK